MLKPLSDKIIVRKIETEKIGSIVIAEGQSNSLFPTFRGKILSIGAAVTLDVEINDIVLYPKQCGIPLEDNGEKIVMLFEKEILAVDQSTH